VAVAGGRDAPGRGAGPHSFVPRAPVLPASVARRAA
jgi:hypothetical protein